MAPPKGDMWHVGVALYVDVEAWEATTCQAYLTLLVASCTNTKPPRVIFVDDVATTW